MSLLTSDFALGQDMYWSRGAGHPTSVHWHTCPMGVGDGEGATVGAAEVGTDEGNPEGLAVGVSVGQAGNWWWPQS